MKSGYSELGAPTSRFALREARRAVNFTLRPDLDKLLLSNSLEGLGTISAPWRFFQYKRGRREREALLTSRPRGGPRLRSRLLSRTGVYDKKSVRRSIYWKIETTKYGTIIHLKKRVGGKLGKAVSKQMWEKPGKAKPANTQGKEADPGKGAFPGKSPRCFSREKGARYVFHTLLDV